ncbi:hypothetical protein P8452_42532 [Trifolium repens]|nr:hypothetical protein P8452_42532 [Trifolium repens]
MSRSAVVQQRINCFSTTIDPQQDKIQICKKFKSDWKNELENEPCGLFVHPSGNTAFTELHLDEDNSYMTSGRMVSLLFGIRELTKIVITYQIKNTCFALTPIQEEGDIKLSSLFKAEDEALFPCLKNTYTLHPFENDQIFGWQQKITKPYTSEMKNQVLHIPKKTAEFVLRGKKEITIKTKHNLNGGKWTIHTYTRPNGTKDKSFTDGWYGFNQANNLQEGDLLQFKLSDPPHVMVVEIVRCNQSI